MVSDVWFEGSKSVRETSKLVSSPKTIMWILIVCVLFVVCLFVVMSFFSLSYLPFRIDLGKAGSLASWFCLLFVCFNPESLGQWFAVATSARPHQP